MATEWNMRVSDADRDVVAGQLREHFAQGRLTHQELDQRLDRAFAARTRTDLDAVTSDLPYAPPAGLLPSHTVPSSTVPSSTVPSSNTGGHGGWGGGQRAGASGRGFPGGALLRIIPVLIALWACFLIVGALGFGVGSGPSVLVFALAAVAAVRWLFRRRWFRVARPHGPARRSRRRW
jgi:hypothetical protein